MKESITVVTKILFENKFTAIAEIDPVDVQLVQSLFIKSGPSQLISEISPLSSIFKQIDKFIGHNHSFLSYDLKVKDVVKGKYPSICGWHCDGINIEAYDQSHQDRYLILVNDENCLTQFISEPVELEVNPLMSVSQQMKSFQDQIEYKKIRSEKIPPWTLVEYSNRSFHTVTAPLKDHRRLLIRVNESDYIKPRLSRIEKRIEL